MNSNNVLILTTPDCGNCKKVEMMLDNLDVTYKVIDVTKEPEYLQKYPIFTAPGIVIDDRLEFTGIPEKRKLVERLNR